MVKKDNTLIKKTSLISFIKNKKVSRLDGKFISFLDKYFLEELDKIIDLAKESALINGRKTLKKQDIEYAIDKLQDKEVSWEI